MHKEKLETSLEMTVDYFIQKFEAIPEEKWTERTYEFENKKCALGHCDYNNIFGSLESVALIKFFYGLKNTTDINDGCDPRYPQPTPKARILAALRDLKK